MEHSQFFNHSQPDIRFRGALEKELSRSCAISNFGWLVGWLVTSSDFIAFPQQREKGLRVVKSNFTRSNQKIKSIFSQDQIFIFSSVLPLLMLIT
jgi:hypothetical protein